MINVVLRKSDVPQPLVLPVDDDGLVPVAYEAAGWTIDAETTVEDALAEIDKITEQLRVAQFEAPPATPRFASTEEAEPSAEQTAAEQTPVEQAPVEQAPVEQTAAETPDPDPADAASLAAAGDGSGQAFPAEDVARPSGRRR